MSQAEVRVSLVGAGPGDPELLTLRALRRIQGADVILFDALVDDAIISFAAPHARLIDVGKRPGAHSWTQPQINARLVLEAQSGGRVVRLKGGDPFVFGRGGEEALALSHAGIAFEVVPGISASIAAASSAHIPVTHRGIATHFTVMTGSSAADLDDLSERWEHLAAAGGTLVFLMPVANLDAITARLIAGGLAPSTPAALIEAATTPRQRTLTTSLAALPASARAHGISSPATLIVGDVVNLHPLLQPPALALTAPTFHTRQALHVPL
jgi:uroporphyrin-III C-methyltransferase